MGNLLLLYDNQADIGFVTGPASTLPLSNLQNSELARVWRSVDTDPVNTTFNVTLPEPTALRAVILSRTNATTAARTRYRAYGDSDRTLLVYDSGWLQFATRAPFGSLPWGALNLWTGFVAQDDPDRPPDLVHLLPSAGVSQRFWTIEIDDSENPNGFFEASRLLMSRAFAPSINYGYGRNSLAFEDNTVRRPILSGGETALRRINPRVTSFGIDYLPDEEAFGSFYDAWRRSGFDRDVYFIPDSEMTGLDLQRRAFLATISQADPIVQAAFGHSSVGVTVKERI